MTSITLNELAYLWDTATLDSLEVGESSEEVEYKPGIHPAYGLLGWFFSADPAACTFDIEFSDGSGKWVRLMSFTDLMGQTYILLTPGRYRAILRAKTGTTEAISLTLFAKPDYWGL